MSETERPLNPCGHDFNRRGWHEFDRAKCPITQPTGVALRADYAAALRGKGLLMTREIQNNPQELADLAQSQVESERGEVRWLDDDAPAGDSGGERG